MKKFIFALKIVFKDSLYLILGSSLALNLLALYYFFFLKSTTLEVFFQSNSAFYNWLSILITLLISIAFGIAISFLVWQRREKISLNPGHTGNNFIGAFLGALSAGCPVCGAFLASVLGIAGGLFAFPFQGLEIKVISLGLMGFAIFSSVKAISNKKEGVCGAVSKTPLIKVEEKKLILNFKKETLRPLLPAFIGFLLLFLVAYLPVIADKLNFGFTFQKKAAVSSALESITSTSSSAKVDSKNLLETINPSQGYTISAVYGNIGPKLLASGAIDFEKMKSLYEQSGQPLTDEQIKILTQGSNEKIKITPENSYFLLNFLWALGLANKNPILDEGPMMKYGGEDKIGNFASTGGWTLGTKKATELYSQFPIITLNSQQQVILEDFAFNSYRPCCSNPTGFPDCNHGMAALALGEIMASQGATVEEIFEAFKYFNAFWFPQTYFDVAMYFLAKDGKDWSQVEGRVVAGKDYSTPQGWQRVRQWLTASGLLEEAPSGGGGCGV